MIDLKKQSPVGSGVVMCASIYCGPGTPLLYFFFSYFRLRSLISLRTRCRFWEWSATMDRQPGPVLRHAGRIQGLLREPQHQESVAQLRFRSACHFQPRHQCCWIRRRYNGKMK